MLTIEHWPIERFRPYERNPRKNDKAVDQMRASLREFGFAVPVLARSTGDVCDGHLRLKAAAVEKQWPGGDVAAIPVVLCDGWTEAQMKAFRLMANRSVTWADWNMEALALEFGELKAMDFDLSLTGFDTREIDQFTLAPNPAEDDVPPVPESPVTRAGDLWLLGEHRLLCGDSTKTEDVARAMGCANPNLMVTDPPYGVNYNPTWRDPVGEFGFGVHKTVQRGKTPNDDRADWTLAWQLFSGNVAYVWHASLHTGEVIESLVRAGFEHRAQIIWRKQQALISRGAYHWQHEPCWYAVRKGESANWRGDRKQSTVWDIQNLNPTGNRDEERVGHGAQKPVECMRRPILNHTDAGDAVYDPFLGSGTAIVASELAGRRCFGLEIEPTYCDVIVTRWQNLTNKQATLEGSGATFDHVKAGRRQEAEDAIMEECHEALG